MRKVNRSRGVFAVLAVVTALVLGAALPGAVFAQDKLNNPSASEYEPDVPPSTGTETGSGAESAGGGGGGRIGSLPFTGMDLIILAGVATVLTGTGVALRRLSMPRGTRS